MSSARPVVEAKMAEFRRFVTKSLQDYPDLTKTEVVKWAATQFSICRSSAWRWLQAANPDETRSPEAVVKELQERRSWRGHRKSFAKLGVTESMYQDKLIRQNGVCAICELPPGKRRLAVDHNHTTGQIRGLLCIRCNFSVSTESSNVLRRAASYLDFWSEVPVENEDQTSRISVRTVSGLGKLD